jgi:uncharacterized membrane protein
LIVLLIFLPALSANLGMPVLSGPVYLLFEPFCHQLDGRSFHLGGARLAVCARCTGFYLGLFWGGIIFMMSKNPLPKFMLLTMAMLAADGLLNFLGIITTPAWARFGIGLGCGLSGGWLLGFGVNDLEEMLRGQKVKEWTTGNIT